MTDAFSSPDVQNLTKQVCNRTQLHKEDAIRLHKLVENHRESVIHYQPYKPNEQDFLLILMDSMMRSAFQEYGPEVIFMDATGSTNMYGFPSFGLLIRDKYGRGVPLAFILTSNEDQPTIERALSSV
jgi:hypothetical protein